MSDSSSQLTTDEQEQLVAYLDGELSEERCILVEDRLAKDAAYRYQMQRLARAWDALDELPHVTAGEEFAKTTIEMVTVAAEKELTAKTLSIEKNRLRRIVWTFGLLAAMAILGWIAAQKIWPNPNQLLLADLPVIERLDAYIQFREVDFLRQLARKLDGQLNQVREEELRIAYNDVIAVSNASHEERQQRIADMDPEAKEELASRFARFEELSSSEQQRLRRLHQEMILSKDAPELMNTLTQYMAWLQNLSAGNRAELRGLPTEKRVDRIAEMIRRDRQFKTPPLSSVDLKAVRDTAVNYLDQHQDELIREFVPTGQLQERFNRNDRHRFAAWWFLLGSHPQRRNAEKHLGALYQQVEKVLSDDARRVLSENSKDRMRDMIMLRWIGEAILGKRNRLEVTYEELESFFASDDLSNDQKEWLLALPRDQIVPALHRLYVQKQYGGWTGPDRSGRMWRGDRPGAGQPRRGERGDRRNGSPPDGPPRGPGFRDQANPFSEPPPPDSHP